ncbi:zinc finger protein 888 isoform X1 [Dendroctonus ponderosae]|uniref:zinc finger protein 888 isoform X1 n=1 Tax=Dendroctonus ponderosae TaxID=77166 RepID=UPI0020353646|nr:zinc finger protein 888 isoform X1 [Dendroctonus ponderosae]KAH1018405.1 hypothetical protein HUJ05_006185 [Dendroctonus ponderosae]
MTNGFTYACCICMQINQVLYPLDTLDADNVNHLEKLTFCAPNETWKAYYKLCPPCSLQLDSAYKFVQCCIESEAFRRENLDALAEKESIDDNCSSSPTHNGAFTCDHCGRTFRQKRYLSQHITKLHIKKKREAVKNEENSTQEFIIKCDASCDVKSEVAGIAVKNESCMPEDQNKENQETLQDEANALANSIKSQIKKSDPSDEECDDEESGNDFNLITSSYSVKSEDLQDENDFDEKPKPGAVKKKSFKRKPQKCCFCDEIFKKRQDWTVHLRAQHATEKPFSCDQCDARYMNRYSLLIHSRKHTNEKPFICATCGKSFVSSADLNHHNKIHNKHRAYPCPMCDRSFKTHSNLRTHRLQMHLDPAEWKFLCKFCDKKFPIRGNLMKHLKRHEGIKEFECHICEKKFVNKAELMLHLNTHTNQRLFKCSYCAKDYKNREGLRRHMKVVHDQGNWKAPATEKKYLCPMCPKIFAFGNKLQRHIFTHTGEKPFKCEYCPKRFIDKYGKKMHYRKDHMVDILT